MLVRKTTVLLTNEHGVLYIVKDVFIIKEIGHNASRVLRLINVSM